MHTQLSQLKGMRNNDSPPEQYGETETLMYSRPMYNCSSEDLHRVTQKHNVHKPHY